MNPLLSTPRGEIILRQAQLTDALPYRQLRLEALRLHPTAFSADYAATLEQPAAFWEERLRALGEEGMIFFAARENELIGMCGIHRDQSPKTRHNALIVGVYVKAEWRGLHLAEALIDQCVQWAQARGVKLLKLGVATSNPTAIRCYARCGFEIYGIEPQAICVDGVMIDELLMARRL